MAKPTYYEVLQVSREADDTVIRAAFAALARKRQQESTVVNEETRAHLERLNEAFDVLTDPIRRAAYDIKAGQPVLSFSKGAPVTYAATPATAVVMPAPGGNSIEPPVSAAWLSRGDQAPADLAVQPAEASVAQAELPLQAEDATPAAKPKSLPFGYVVMACFIGGRYMAIEASKRNGDGLDKLSFIDQMMSGPFWDLMARPAGTLLLGAWIAWFIARRTPIKNHASIAALAVVLLLCFQALG